MDLTSSLGGALTGTLVGEMVGYPFEGFHRDKVRGLTKTPIEQSLLRGKGMYSATAEQALLVAYSLRESQEPETFRTSFGRKLKHWILSLPVGASKASVRSAMRLLLGSSPHQSSVWSLGSAPVVRSPILGILFKDEPALLLEMVSASSCTTHADPEVMLASLAVACAAAVSFDSSELSAPEKLEALVSLYSKAAPSMTSDPMANHLNEMTIALNDKKSVEGYSTFLGCGADGVTNYALYVAPIAIYAWLIHGLDFRKAITQVIQLGGNTGELAAITGALIGAGLGVEAIPDSWLKNTWVSLDNLPLLAKDLVIVSSYRKHGGSVGKCPPLSFKAPWFITRLARNFIMYYVVMFKALRRGAFSALKRKS